MSRSLKTVTSELVLTLKWISRNSILNTVLVHAKTTTPKKHKVEAMKLTAIYRVVVEHELHLFQFYKLADAAVTYREIIQQLQGLRNYLLTAAPVFQVGYATNATLKHVC